jgi:hypothetical protein
MLWRGQEAVHRRIDFADGYSTCRADVLQVYVDEFVVHVKQLVRDVCQVKVHEVHGVVVRHCYDCTAEDAKDVSRSEPSTQTTVKESMTRLASSISVASVPSVWKAPKAHVSHHMHADLETSERVKQS